MGENEASLLLSDRYLLLDRLGSGGMGTVWRATDQVLDRTVAVKEMHIPATDYERAKQTARARREAHAIARISHPNVVNVHDLVEHDERFWLVMEFVDGPSLKEHVDAGGPMSPGAVAAIGLQLLSALQAVHATGALHRDVKPGNVLLRPDDRVILCDFGIAALTGADSITATGAVVGSYEYLAPERLGDRPVGPASDLFSLGVTLCALLSGRSPFARPEALGVLNAILKEKAEIPPTAGPLRRPLEALLRKDPDDRPSIAEAMEMLRPFAAAEQTAPDLPKRGRPSGPLSRRSLVGLAALAAVVVVAAGTAVALLSGSDEDRGSGTAAATAPAAPAPSPAGTPEAAAAPLRTDALMPVPGGPNPNAPGAYWVFSGDRYIRAEIATTGHPLRRALAAPSTLAAWDDTFKNLPGFRSRIDAVLRVPGSPNEYWVFSGKQYIRIRIDPGNGYEDTLVSGPRPLADWGSTFGEFADIGIDAVMRTPDDPSQYWVFAGDRYARVTVHGEGPGGFVTHGPVPIAGWPGTFNRYPRFRKGIDAAMPVPGERNRYWVFSGDRYMKINVTDVAYEDTVVEGPGTLRDWSALGS